MLSVIIPTRNRADLLAQTLESIHKQDLASARYEVIVVDNGSTDDTRRVIDRYKDQLTNLTGIYAPEPGLHTGRHAGMKAAKGDILVFADDDIEALPSWLSSIEKAFTDPVVALVGGNNYPMFLDTPPRWLYKLWNRQAFRGYKAIPALSILEFTRTPRKMTPYLVWGCNFAIRKQVLLQAGGFHPDGMPRELIRFRGDGETHVSRYIAETGLKCIFHPDASVLHKVPPERMTYAYFYQRGFNQGVSDSYTQLRNQKPADLAEKQSFMKRALKFTRRFATNLLNTADVRHALAEFQRGYREGYAYHQAAYRDDPEVREWVHRPIYF